MNLRSTPQKPNSPAGGAASPGGRGGAGLLPRRLSLACVALLLLAVWLLPLDGMQAEAETPVADPASVATTLHADLPDGDALLHEPPPLLEPLDVHPRTSLTILEQLRHNHFLSKDLDDHTSEQIFDNYLEQLDAGKAYLLASDIAGLSHYRTELDEALQRGKLEPAFEIFNVYQRRQVDRLQFLLEELDHGIAGMDFTGDETMDVDRENADWPIDEAELDRIWRQRLKASVLSMKLNGRDDDEIQELLTKRYRNRLKQTLQTKPEDVFQLYVNAFTAVYDPHTNYFSPRTSQNFNINMSLSLEGIGAVLKNEDEYTSVVELVPAGPADKSGLLKPSDRIVSVGQGETGPLIDIVGWRLDDVVELIRGPKDSQVRLEVIPHLAEDSGTRVITITRNTVQLEEQAAQKKLLTLDHEGVSTRVGIIEIPTFYADFKALQEGDPNYKSTTRDVRRLIDELKEEKIDGLVIDLRNNGGGSLQEADSLTGLFIPSGPTVQVKSANRRPSVYADNDGKTAWDGPLIILVNRLSASASEIFAGAIQDYGRGLIVGSQTFGKGTVQTLIPLNRGQLKVTAAKFYRISGNSTQHRGVLPDIAFPEVFNTEEIGESALDAPLPWDQIAPVKYTHNNALGTVVEQLNERHEGRVADDPDFAYLRAIAERTRETADEDVVSLNYATRKAEKADSDRWRLDLENSLRIAHGKKPVATLEELEEVAADEEAELEDPANDPMLRESAEILDDYLEISRQIAGQTTPQQSASRVP